MRTHKLHQINNCKQLKKKLESTEIFQYMCTHTIHLPLKQCIRHEIVAFALNFLNWWIVLNTCHTHTHTRIYTMLE